MKLFVHPLFFVVIGLSIWLGFGAFIAALVFAVLVHEFSHLWMARRYGVVARQISLLPFGAEVNIECGFLGEGARALILLSGAGGNILVALGCSSLLWFFPTFYSVLEIIIVANVVPAVLNLLPIYPLDGGKVVELCLPGGGVKWFVLFSNIVFVLGFVFSCVIWNVALMVLCGVMMFTINFDFKQSCFVSRINVAAKGSKARVAEVAIDRRMSLFEIYRMVSPKYYTKFVLTDMGNRVFYENDLEKFLFIHSLDTQIGQVI